MGVSISEMDAQFFRVEVEQRRSRGRPDGDGDRPAKYTVWAGCVMVLMTQIRDLWVSVLGPAGQSGFVRLLCSAAKPVLLGSMYSTPFICGITLAKPVKHYGTHA